MHAPAPLGMQRLDCPSKLNLLSIGVIVDLSSALSPSSGVEVEEIDVVDFTRGSALEPSEVFISEVDREACNAF